MRTLDQLRLKAKTPLEFLYMTVDVLNEKFLSFDMKIDTMSEFSFLRWNENLGGNSYSCPLDVVRNFNHDPMLHIGYPGWCGRINGTNNWNHDNYRYSPLDLFKTIPGFNTGSGWGRGSLKKGYTWGVDIRFYLQDFPNMDETSCKSITCNVIQLSETYYNNGNKYNICCKGCANKFNTTCDTDLICLNSFDGYHNAKFFDILDVILDREMIISELSESSLRLSYSAFEQYHKQAKELYDAQYKIK